MIDLEDMRRALLALKLAFDDADAVAEDMLRAPRKRQLGPVLHRKNYGDARASMLSGLDYLIGITKPEPENGDPSGNGGAGPVH